MTVRQKENLKERIFKNDDITTAQTNLYSAELGRESKKNKYMLQRANSIVNNYKRSKQEVEDRMMQRYEKMLPTKPVTPRLRTLLRAD